MDKRLERALQTIHATLRVLNYRLSEEEIQRADQEILPFLEANIVPHMAPIHYEDKMNNFTIGSIIYPEIIRYYAIAQNNVPLLERLQQAKFPFHLYGKQLPLFVLNKHFSSHFGESEYVSFVMRGHASMKRFRDSLIFSPEDEKNGLISMFADLIRSDPSLLDVGKKAKDGNDYYDLLTKQKMLLFDKKFFVQMNHLQRMILNTITGRLNEEDASKIKELFHKYPKFHPTMPFQIELLRELTIEELGNMSQKDERLYLLAIRNNTLPKMREILKLDPLFNCPDRFVREEVLRVLDSETIVGLTEEGKREISNISVSEVENVTFFPIKKINIALFKDKIRKKKMENGHPKLHK